MSATKCGIGFHGGKREVGAGCTYLKEFGPEESSVAGLSLAEFNSRAP